MKKRHPRPEVFVRSQVVADTPPAPVEEDDATGTDDDAPSTGSSDDVGGLIGDGKSDGPPAPGGAGVDVLAFGEGMTRPECDRSALSDLYSRSREAREAHIEGTMVVQCSIMADGSVQDCWVLKPLAHLSELALAAMTNMSCKPATFQGKPVSIRYVQNLQFALPR